MTNDEQINLARARLSYLNGQMATAVALGDADRKVALEVEIEETAARIRLLEDPR